jgi:hypothetical protein
MLRGRLAAAESAKSLHGFHFRHCRGNLKAGGKQTFVRR